MNELTATLCIDSRCLLGEGIVWCARRRVLYWTDIVGARLWRHALDSGDTRHWPMPQALGCVALADDGRLLLGLAKGLYVCDVERHRDAPELPLSKLVDVQADDPLTRINDGRADRDGGFVFGTKSEHSDRRRAGRFFQFTTRHGLRELGLPPAVIPNSICFDADGTRMHFCDSVEPRILSCRYDADAAKVSELATFVELDVPGAEPDGSIVDVEGGVWNAQWSAGRVVRYLPHGRPDLVVHVPASLTTCCALVGDTLYVTSARDGLDPRDAAAQPHAGAVFACRLGRSLERSETAVRLS